MCQITYDRAARYMYVKQGMAGGSAFRWIAITAVMLAAGGSWAANAADSAVGAEPNVLTEQQVREGWISLFDGQTLFGWQPTSDADWSVADGALRAADGKQGFLMTGVDFADYDLHVEFKAPAATNSGVFLRTPLNPSDPAQDCLELNIAPADNPFPTGSLVSRKKWTRPDSQANLASRPPLVGANDGKRNSSTAAIDPKGGWRSFDVTAEGEMITIRLDGEWLYTYKAKEPRRGRIGLQFREGAIAFRNIRLRPLGLKPISNGKDLAGWNTDLAREAQFDLTAEGELHIAGGPGQLETDASFGDFVMQWDSRVDGDGLNSGVFFRSIPRDFANGYECQINNAIEGGDATKPKDAGTGAIYRRTTARRVVSRDHQWFTTTLIAEGPRIAVWVEGQQVTDWIDERPPDDNPRRGLRLAPGTISLQAHDPTTNLRFRNLRIVELPANSP